MLNFNIKSMEKKLFLFIIELLFCYTGIAQSYMYICSNNEYNRYRIDQIDSITFRYPNSCTQTEHIPDFQNWQGKTIVWLGTSIPSMGYPTICGQYIGAKVYNEAEGSSMARRGNTHHSDDPLSDDYLGVKGLAWQSVLYSLSLSQKDKHYIMENWTAARRKNNLIKNGYNVQQVKNVKGYVSILGGSFFGTETDPNQDGDTGEPSDIMDNKWKTLRQRSLRDSWDSSFDIEPGFGYMAGKLQKYFTKEKFPDLWVFDHGHNDGIESDTKKELTEIPYDPYDCYYFAGAMNFLINKILEYNPHARIVIIGHYTNQEGGTNRPELVTKGQEAIANYWQIPLYKLWNDLPFSQRIVTTNAYWDSNHLFHDTGFNGSNHVGKNYSHINQNPRQLTDEKWVHDLTMKQIWLWDDLHPTSEEAKELYAETIARWFVEQPYNSFLSKRK